MTNQTSVITIFCAQCSRHAQVRRGDPLPEGWTEYTFAPAKMSGQ